MSANAPTNVVFSKAYRAWLLIMLVLTNALNLADRQNIPAVAQALKLDLKFTDLQLGLVQGLAFALCYTAMGLPLARLAEHVSRTRIVAACLLVFGIMDCLCGTATGFVALLLFRAGVATGDAGFGPPVASLVGDHYPSGKRASVMSIIWLGAPLGVMTGSIVGGWMAEHVSWRASFAAVGIPGILVSLIAFLTLREPPRGSFDADSAARGAPPSIGMVLKFLLAKRSVWHVLIGAGLAAIAMNAIGQFLSPFLARNYHLGFAAAGRMVAGIAGAAMASGLLLGGFGVDWAGRFDKRWYVWGPAVGIGLAAPLFLLGFNQTTVATAVALLVVAHVSMFVYYTPTLALAQNMVGANMRASSAFVASLVLNLAGIALGPTLVGILSDRFAVHAFGQATFAATCPGGAAPPGSAATLVAACANASAAGLRHALMVMSLLSLWSALHFLLAARTLRRDLETRYEATPGVPPEATPAHG
jgi:predicted MFS family arabinose efflux permease